MFTWASFENHWDVLLREFAKRRQKETQILTTDKSNYENAYYTTKKQQLRHNIIKRLNFFTRRWMGLLNEENKLQVDEKNNEN